MCRPPDFSSQLGQKKSVDSVSLPHNPNKFGQDVLLCQEGFDEIDTNGSRPAAICGHRQTFLSETDAVTSCPHSRNRIRKAARSSFISEPLIHLVIGDQAGRDVLELAKRGDLGGMSFGFTATDEIRDGDHRELRSVDLHEISVVAGWPAYDGTIVEARSKQVSTSYASRVIKLWEAGT